jgi:hypothetical protein
MKTFIRVVELWVPDRTGTRLEYGGGLCSDEFSEFREISENTLFAFDEGLPGRAWAAGHPIVLTEFSNSYFKRADEAREVGLTCGVALPVFAGEFLMAVLVLWCGDDAKHVGAIELWHNDPEVSHEMGLVDGYFGTADMFEFNSRHTKFPRGFGLPGRVWKAGMPLIIKDLHNSKRFLRWEEASEITTSQDANRIRANHGRTGCCPCFICNNKACPRQDTQKLRYVRPPTKVNNILAGVGGDFCC